MVGVMVVIITDRPSFTRSISRRIIVWFLKSQVRGGLIQQPYVGSLGQDQPNKPVLFTPLSQYNADPLSVNHPFHSFFGNRHSWMKGSQEIQQGLLIKTICWTVKGKAVSDPAEHGQWLMQSPGGSWNPNVFHLLLPCPKKGASSLPGISAEWSCRTHFGPGGTRIADPPVPARYPQILDGLWYS